MNPLLLQNEESPFFINNGGSTFVKMMGFYDNEKVDVLFMIIVCLFTENFHINFVMKTLT